MSIKQIGSTLPIVMNMIESMDKVEDYVRKNSGFQKHPGTPEVIHKDFIQKLRLVDSKKDLKTLLKKPQGIF